MIGLSESADRYEERGFTPLRLARLQQGFRRYGMPFALAPKTRSAATARALSRDRRRRSERARLRVGRAACAAALPVHHPPDPRGRRAHLGRRRGGNGDSRSDHPRAARQPRGRRGLRPRSRPRRARPAAPPAEFQGTTATTDEGVVRFTAPSVIFERDGTRLVAGGFQPVADLRRPDREPRSTPSSAVAAPKDAADALAAFPEGLTTQEVAAIMAAGTDPVDRAAAELAAARPRRGRQHRPRRPRGRRDLAAAERRRPHARDPRRRQLVAASSRP